MYHHGGDKGVVVSGHTSNETASRGQRTSLIDLANQCQQIVHLNDVADTLMELAELIRSVSAADTDAVWQEGFNEGYQKGCQDTLAQGKGA